LTKAQISLHDDGLSIATTFLIFQYTGIYKTKNSAQWQSLQVVRTVGFSGLWIGLVFQDISSKKQCFALLLM